MSALRRDRPSAIKTHGRRRLRCALQMIGIRREALSPTLSRFCAFTASRWGQRVVLAASGGQDKVGRTLGLGRQLTRFLWQPRPQCAKPSA